MFLFVNLKRIELTEISHTVGLGGVSNKNGSFMLRSREKPDEVPASTADLVDVEVLNVAHVGDLGL